MASSQTMKLKMARIYDCLGKAYGKRRRVRCGTLLEQLILTILSSESSEARAFRAFTFLQKEYVDWNEVRVSDELCLSDELRKVGVNSGAPTLLKTALENLLLEKSSLQPEILDSLSFQEVSALLAKINLPKSLAASLLLMDGQARRPGCVVQVPVDEGVARMMWRMGFASTPRATVQIQESLRAFMPEGEEHNFHRVAARFTRNYCSEARPACPRCLLRTDCLYPLKSGAPDDKPVSAPRTIRQTGVARRSRPPSRRTAQPDRHANPKGA